MRTIEQQIQYLIDSDKTVVKAVSQEEFEKAKLSVKKNPYNFEYVSDELKGDKEFALIAVEKDPDNFQYVSDALKGDKELALIAVKKNPYNFYHVSKELKGDKEFALIAVEGYPHNFKYVSDELQNELSLKPFHKPSKEPENINISKNTPPSLYNLVRYSKKSGIREITWKILEKLDLSEDKYVNNLIREYNQIFVSPKVKDYIKSLENRGLSKQEFQEKIKEYRGKLNSNFRIPLEFIVNSRGFHGEILELKELKNEITEEEQKLKIKPLDFGDPEIKSAVKEFRNTILNKGIIKHHTWTGAQKIFPVTNHVMMLVIPKNLIPKKLYEINKDIIDDMVFKSEHPFIKGNLTIGWVRYTLGKDVTKNQDNERVWIDEVQTDFSRIFGKHNMKQVFPIEKISYLLVKKFIKFIRGKGFEEIYIPNLGLASGLYSRGKTYSPPYTSIPQKLRFKKEKVKDFHKKVDGKEAWVLAGKKKYTGYTFNLE
jgi:hypothetical protein